MENAFAYFILYKIICLIIGFASVYMGYRLFLADKTNPAGDVDATAHNYQLKLKGAAPGIFFSLFGTIVICFTIFKGSEYHDTVGIGSDGRYDRVVNVPHSIRR